MYAAVLKRARRFTYLELVFFFFFFLKIEGCVVYDLFEE